MPAASLTTTPLGRQLQFDITQQTDLENVPDINIRANPTTLFGLDIDNTITAAASGYVKLFDSDGAGLAADVAAGNARADIVIPVVGVGQVGATPITGRTLVLMPSGLAFENGLCWLAATTSDNAVGVAPTIALQVQAITQETT